MASHRVLPVFLLVVAITYAAAARILNEDTPAATVGQAAIGSGALPASGSGPLPIGGSGPLPIGGSVPLPIGGSGPLPIGGSGPLPTGGSGPLPTGGSGPLPTGGSGPLPTGGSGPLPAGPAGAVGSSAVGGSGGDHALTFIMHDILGGSNPSARAVTGVVSNPAVSGQVPFAKPNGANLPINNGVPTNNNNNGIVNNNNIPFLTGLSGTTGNIVQNNGNGNNVLNGFPINGQIPSGSALQQLMFGTMTVIDDELTEGHELGSGLVGKAQGFYVASSIDGSSQTMAFTAMFESGGYEDSLSFFGIHRTAVSESHLAVMGGTGKYVNAKGFAVVKTFGARTNQQQTDGFETLLEVTVYLSY